MVVNDIHRCVPVKNKSKILHDFLFVFVFNFVFYHLELSSTVVQPVHHGHGHYRGLSVRQTSSLLETGRTDVGSGQVVPPNTFVDPMACSVRVIGSFNNKEVGGAVAHG